MLSSLLPSLFSLIKYTHPLRTPNGHTATFVANRVYNKKMAQVTLLSLNICLLLIFLDRHIITMLPQPLSSKLEHGLINI